MKKAEREKKKKPKILLLFSGGLDSRVAATLLKEQAEVECIFFILPFGGGCCNDKTCAFNFSQTQLLKLHIIDCTKGKNLRDYIEILKKPEFGYGTSLNPCIDCHLYMLKKAKQLAKKLKIDILATGEVLDERPMSQHKKALDIIEKESGLKGKLLRPLSAKLLSPTDSEKKGIINREKLLSIHGRQRKRQMQLAEKYKIKYPNAGGGCLLCEPGFCQKLKPLLKGKIQEIDIELVRIGRHFQDSKIILGKNQEDNEKLEQIHKKYKKGIIITPEQSGPTAYIKNKKLVEKAKKLIQKYSKHKIKDFKIKED